MQQPKMYVLVRGDIEMSPGKLASQVGHGFKILAREATLHYPDLADQYFADGSGTNIVLLACSLQHLENIWNEISTLECPKVLFEDEGHIHLPDFDGSPIVTVLGIGPICKSALPMSVQKLPVL